MPRDHRKRALDILTEAAALYHAVERAVVLEGCPPGSPAAAPLAALERYRRRVFRDLAEENDAQRRAAMLIVQLCGVTDDNLSGVDRAQIRREVPAHSPLWATAANLLTPGVVYALTWGDPEGRQYVDDMMRTQPDREFRAMLALGAFWEAFEDRDRDRWESLLSELEELDDDADELSLIRDQIERLRGLTAGSPAPAFDVPGLDAADGRHALDRFRGRLLLLHFWSTWCEPCLDDIATLHEAYDRYRGRGLEILSVSEDERARDVRAFRADARYAMPWCHAYVGTGNSGNTVSDDYVVHSLPRLVLIGPDGRIVEESTSRLRGTALLRRLEEALSENGLS